MEEELVNAEYGIDMVPTGRARGKWWAHPRFPLVPLWSVRDGDKYNCRSWSFTWLNVRLWSLEHVSLTFEAGIDNQGVSVGAILPYLRVWIWLLPLPDGWLYGLRRKPPAALEEPF